MHACWTQCVALPLRFQTGNVLLRNQTTSSDLLESSEQRAGQRLALGRNKMADVVCPFSTGSTLHMVHAPCM